MMEFPYNKCQRELQELLEAKYPLIFLRSSEETRAIQCVIEAQISLVSAKPELDNGAIARWSSVDGFQKRTVQDNDPDKVAWTRVGSAPQMDQDPILQALSTLRGQLEEASKNNVSQYTYLLPDWPTFIKPDSDLTARQLKELAIAIEQKRPQPRMTLIIVSSDWSIPTILRNNVHILDLQLPIGKELYQKVFKVAVNRYGLMEKAAERLSEQAQGISEQATLQTAKLITSRNLWSSAEEAGKLLLEIKKQEIRKTGVLEYDAPQGEGLEDVGGLQEIKAWVEKSYPLFEQDYRPDMRPRAILLEGFPGCGKSFIAKAIAQEWRVPQINFEISRLQSKWIGESESNTNQALRAIEASAPNILFMDEIEKAFSGVGGDTSGVSTRQFGTFLTWLNEHRYPIFFIATSNNREQLPPELFRAGRFDEIFIVMPPNAEERLDILQKRAISYQLTDDVSIDFNFLVRKTSGFSGAELDKLVKETIRAAGLEQIPTQTHWEEALKQINPQYRIPSMQALLRKYMKLLEDGGGRPASTLDEPFLESLIIGN
jgi:ATP-dependent 26S proteasome regulatory subunit